MLAKTAQHLTPYENTKRTHRAVVKDNNDPRKLGRVRAEIKDLIQGETTNLPWISPEPQPNQGGSPDLSQFEVPEIGTEITVYFPDPKNQYAPVYKGRRLSEANSSQLFEEDYPNMWGWIDSTLQWLRFNKLKKWFEYFRYVGKELIRLDENGNLLINIPGNLILNIGKEVKTNVGGNITQTIGGTVGTNIGGNLNTNVAGLTSHKTNGIHMANSGSASAMCGGAVIIQGTEVEVQASGNLMLNGSQILDNCGAHVSNNGPGDSQGEISNTIQATLQEIQTKIDELTALADKIKEKADKYKGSDK